MHNVPLCQYDEKNKLPSKFIYSNLNYPTNMLLEVLTYEAGKA